MLRPKRRSGFSGPARAYRSVLPCARNLEAQWSSAARCRGAEGLAVRRQRGCPRLSESREDAFVAPPATKRVVPGSASFTATARVVAGPLEPATPRTSSQLPRALNGSRASRMLHVTTCRTQNALRTLSVGPVANPFLASHAPAKSGSSPPGPSTASHPPFPRLASSGLPVHPGHAAARSLPASIPTRTSSQVAA